MRRKNKPVHDLHRKDDHMHTREVFHDLFPILVIIIVFLILIAGALSCPREANAYEHLEQIVATKDIWVGLL